MWRFKRVKWKILQLNKSPFYLYRNFCIVLSFYCVCHERSDTQRNKGLRPWADASVLMCGIIDVWPKIYDVTRPSEATRTKSSKITSNCVVMYSKRNLSAGWWTPWRTIPWCWTSAVWTATRLWTSSGNLWWSFRVTSWGSIFPIATDGDGPRAPSSSSSFCPSSSWSALSDVSTSTVEFPEYSRKIWSEWMLWPSKESPCALEHFVSWRFSAQNVFGTHLLESSSGWLLHVPECPSMLCSFLGAKCFEFGGWSIFNIDFFGQKLPDSEFVVSRGFVIMLDASLLRRTARRILACISK